MRSNKKTPVDTTFEAAGLRKKNFTFAGDVMIEGDVVITGVLIVGGDLTVTGLCTVNELVCLGNVSIGADMKFGNIRMRGVLSCGGSLIGEDLYVTGDVLDVRYLGSPGGAALENAVLEFGEKRTEKILEENADPFVSGKSVDVKGDLDIDEFAIDGGLCVGKECIFIDGEIRGAFECGGDIVGWNLCVYGEIVADRKIQLSYKLLAGGNLHCRWSCVAGEIEAHQNLDVGYAIVADGDIVVNGHIKSDNRIQARGILRAGKSIQSASSIFASKGVEVGNDYGIYAGLNVPHSRMAEHGYVASRVKPLLLKSGVHVKGKRFKELNEQQLITWPAEDESDGLSSFY